MEEKGEKKKDQGVWQPEKQRVGNQGVPAPGPPVGFKWISGQKSGRRGG